ncbi:MAG: hypothetical protein K2K28_04105 [Clostridia bacterium]|nr:hypothetical protein [Clostridia bacterium]
MQKIYTGGVITKRIKDKNVEKAELMEEIRDILDDYLDCEFTQCGETHYMNFADGDIYAISLVKCNNLTTEKEE